MPDDDVLADRYEVADATLRDGGLRLVRGVQLGHVARPPAAGTTSCTGPTPTGGASGPGAHSHVGGLRWWNVKHPAAYADRLRGGQSPAQDAELLDDADRALETIMLGLRLRDGLPLAALSATGRARARDAVARGPARPGGARGAAAPSSPTAAACSPTP